MHAPGFVSLLLLKTVIQFKQAFDEAQILAAVKQRMRNESLHRMK